MRNNELAIGFIGNPNCGKTTLFNAYTGANLKVANWPGVTVEKVEGAIKDHDQQIHLVDLPGTYSLSAYSTEERFVREYIMNHAPDVVINVVDASNLERNLYLSAQLIDMDVKGVIALNMYDELQKSGAQFDYQALGKMIGMPMVPTVGSKGKGVKELLREVIEVYEGRCETVRHVHINYGSEVEEGIVAVREKLNQEKDLIANASPRFLALMLLEGDAEVVRLVKERAGDPALLGVVEEQAARLEAIFGEKVESVITDAKYGFISGALKETFRESPLSRRRMTEYIDAIVTHKLFGFPIFLLFLFLAFYVTFTLGAYPQGWIEAGVAWLGDWVTATMSEGPLKDLIVDGIIGGVGGVIVFLPQILILFLFISFMEDTGYMARAAFIMDKLMHKIGLHGKSFIPMIMGFGCNVPAIMSARMLENRNDRILTILINPFMSCSARLPVYILLVGAFFEKHAALVLFGLYLTGVVVAIIMAKVFKRLFFHKEEAPFVMELPPYRMPTGRTVLNHMWSKGEQYLKKMGGIIMLASILIWALGYFPVNEETGKKYEVKKRAVEQSYAASKAAASPELAKLLEAEEAAVLESLNREELEEHQENSYIGRIGRTLEPVWSPLGLEWKAGVSMLTGIAAKEIVVSTMAVLYQADEEADSGEISLGDRLKAHGYTPVVAIVFLLFVLLYSPCFATLIVIAKEIGTKWALFVMGYTTVLAWIVCFVVKQVLDMVM